MVDQRLEAAAGQTASRFGPFLKVCKSVMFVPPFWAKSSSFMPAHILARETEGSMFFVLFQRYYSCFALVQQLFEHSSLSLSVHWLTIDHFTLPIINLYCV
jgi:hypothetical protein